MSCLLCGGDEKPWLSMPIDPKKRTGTAYANAVRCDACGLGRIDPLPSADEVPAFYDLDAYYTHGESHFVAADRETLVDKVRGRIADKLDFGPHFDPALFVKLTNAEVKGANVLDIGTGHGMLLEAFKTMGANVAGLDPDPEAMKALAAKGIEAHCGVAEAPPDTLEGRQFDIVTMSHALEHCINPMEALASVRSLVAKDGLFVCETPNSACRHFETFTVISEMYDAPRHLYFFSPDNLRRAIEQSGFEVVERYHSGYARHFRNDWRATENRIRHDMIAQGAEATPPEHTSGRAFMLVLTTAFAAADAKYDSIGFVARAI